MVEGNAVLDLRSDLLRVTEVFYSLQGETSTAGLPTVFVRLTGCPMRCSYCDTQYAFSGGQLRDIPSLLDQIAQYGSRYVTVTGGEPLAQNSCYPFMSALCDAGYRVAVETGGAVKIDRVPPAVNIILDVKTPGSGEMEHNCWDNLQLLRSSDQLKFVLCDRDDYRWAVDLLRRENLAERVAEVLFSPVWGQLPPHSLAEWMLSDRLTTVRLQLQLHKLLWGDEPGR